VKAQIGQKIMAQLLKLNLTIPNFSKKYQLLRLGHTVKAQKWKKNPGPFFKISKNAVVGTLT